MNIYFSCSVTGGRNDQEIYQQIVENLQAHGHTVLTAHLAETDILQREETSDAALVFHRDVEWVMQCDVLIAEVSTPSHGVGYEIALALSLGKMVFCCYQAGRKVSKMILGNDHPGFVVKAYHSSFEAMQIVHQFIDSISAN